MVVPKNSWLWSLLHCIVFHWFFLERIKIVQGIEFKFGESFLCDDPSLGMQSYSFIGATWDIEDCSDFPEIPEGVNEYSFQTNVTITILKENFAESPSVTFKQGCNINPEENYFYLTNVKPGELQKSGDCSTTVNLAIQNNEDIKSFNSRALLNMPLLKKIELNDCGFTSLTSLNHFGNLLPSLTELTFRNNFITAVEDVDFTTFPRLNSLDLKNNKISRLPTYSLTFQNNILSVLDVSDNAITTVERHFLKSVANDETIFFSEYLSINANPIEDIVSGSFEYFQGGPLGLRDILNIDSIPKGTFSNTTNSIELALSGSTSLECCKLQGVEELALDSTNQIRDTYSCILPNNEIIIDSYSMTPHSDFQCCTETEYFVEGECRPCSFDNTEEECIEFSQTCDADGIFQCLVCDESFRLLEKVCVPCAPQANCLTHGACEIDGNYPCLVCDDSYRPCEGGCVPCISQPNCAVHGDCAANGDQPCLECDENFFLINGVCAPCKSEPNCSTQGNCDADGNYACLECMENFYVVQAVCAPCVSVPKCSVQEPCGTDGKYSCLECEETFQLIEGVCIPCISPSNCSTLGACDANGRYSCLVCEETFHLGEGGACTPCVSEPNCSVQGACDNDGKYPCLECEETFQLIEGVCVPCVSEPNCSLLGTCDVNARYSCLACEETFHLIEGVCVPCVSEPNCSVQGACDVDGKYPCLECEETFQLIEGVCNPCISEPNCSVLGSCDANARYSCLACEETFQLIEGVCAPCVSEPNCSVQGACDINGNYPCLECEEMFQLIEGVCIACVSEPHCSTLGDCDVNARYSCLACEETFFLNGGVCSHCVAKLNCSVQGACDANGNYICSECEEEFHLIEGSCIPCSSEPNCSVKGTCNASGNYPCLECEEKFQLIEGVCVPCVSDPNCSVEGPCDISGNSPCLECEEKYQLIAGECVPCVSDPNCLVQGPCNANASYSCLACDESFKLIDEACVPCHSQPNCVTSGKECVFRFKNTTEELFRKCEDCTKGSFLNESLSLCFECEEIVTGCSTYNKLACVNTSIAQCTSCILGYTLRNDVCYLIENASPDSSGAASLSSTFDPNKTSTTIIATTVCVIVFILICIGLGLTVFVRHRKKKEKKLFNGMSKKQFVLEGQSADLNLQTDDEYFTAAPGNIHSNTNGQGNAHDENNTCNATSTLEYSGLDEPGDYTVPNKSLYDETTLEEYDVVEEAIIGSTECDDDPSGITYTTLTRLDSLSDNDNEYHGDFVCSS